MDLVAPGIALLGYLYLMSQPVSLKTQNYYRYKFLTLTRWNIIRNRLY